MEVVVTEVVALVVKKKEEVTVETMLEEEIWAPTSAVTTYLLVS